MSPSGKICRKCAQQPTDVLIVVIYFGLFTKELEHFLVLLHRLLWDKRVEMINLIIGACICFSSIDYSAHAVDEASHHCGNIHTAAF